MQVATVHRDDDVKVDLQLVGDALFDGEELCFMAAIPANEFGSGKEERDPDENDRGEAASRGATGVC